MAYVAGFHHDVFISYSHHDSSDWIQAFETSLAQELGQRLGSPVSIWQDEQELRLGQNWQAEIEEAITGSAAFLTVVSPSYRSSEWCGRERKLFMQQFANREDMRVRTKSGSVYRFLKIVKLPWEDDQHNEFFGEAQHLDFFERDASKGIDTELVPGSDEFQERMRHTVHVVSSLLLALRRAAEAVFVATPPADMEAPGKALAEELSAQGYDVRPEGPLDELYSDEAIKKSMAPAVLSVHLMGGHYDTTSERLLRISQELGKQQVLWLPEEAAAVRSDEQNEFVRRWMGLSAAGTAPTILTGTTRRMIDEVLQILSPRPASPRIDTDGSPSVYLVCDPSSREDARFAVELGEEIATKKGLAVFLSETRAQAHQEKLRACDGVLLYRKSAPIQWLTQNLADVMFADRLQPRLKPLRAKAFLLDDPDLLPGHPNVIPRTSQFRLSDLEPFFASLGLYGEPRAQG